MIKINKQYLFILEKNDILENELNKIQKVRYK